ncbi:MAG: M20/M25/M40 family metallo-hydrolase [Planctomycetales bacterium]|nr:M20/M25/M40 family metallo-hydrolase [Planctomycetales bacterium]
MSRKSRCRGWSLRVSLVLLLSLVGGTMLAPARAEHVNRSSHHMSLFSAALESVKSNELQRHVEVLADDTFEGRQEATRGGRAAAGYLTQLLEKAGLESAGEQGYLQPIPSGGRNILAIYRGADPVLRNEYVLIGGHYDHVGYGTPSNSFGPTGYIHNGADDNASGVSAVLEIVDSLKRLPSRPRRSLLFAFWDGEENGLLGSKHWVSAPTVPLSQIAFAFNVDMVGRLEKEPVEVFGVRTAPGLRSILSHSNHSDLPLSFEWEMKANSDHHSLFQHNIPVLMLHTGLHKDYHRPSDDAHLLDYPGMQQVTRLLLESALRIADMPTRLAFRDGSRVENDTHRAQLEQRLPSLPPRLGVSWRRDDQPGLPLVRVAPGSAAGLAGLRVGDRLLAFAGEPIDDEQVFLRAVVRSPAQTSLTIQRPGEAESRMVALTLQGQPSRWGFGWRLDTGNPGVAVLVRVVPHSTAADAGLQPGDRIYTANDQPIEDDAVLADLLARESRVSLKVERDGRVREVELAPEDAQDGQLPSP